MAAQRPELMVGTVPIKQGTAAGEYAATVMSIFPIANPLIGLGAPIKPKRAWHFPVEQPREAGVPSTEVWVRGKMLGGSSSINGMIYSRGQPDDYSAWEALGATGWGWPTMKAPFKAIEDHELGADDARGQGGPLHISTGKFRYPVSEALVKAGEQLGLPRKEGLNREDLEGVTAGLVDRVLIENQRAVGVVARIGGAERIFRARGEVILSAGAIMSPKIL